MVKTDGGTIHANYGRMSYARRKEDLIHGKERENTPSRSGIRPSWGGWGVHDILDATNLSYRHTASTAYIIWGELITLDTKPSYNTYAPVPQQGLGSI